MTNTYTETPTIRTAALNCSTLDWQLTCGGSNSFPVTPKAWDFFERAGRVATVPEQIQHLQQQDNQMNTNRRIIQVFIADPDINVPLEHALLFRGEQKLTDLTDQELFFEVSIQDLLKQHNEKRIKWTDRDATNKAGKDVFLQPVKIRDLKMTVVSIAAF